jgi:hypothetical protein
MVSVTAWAGLEDKLTEEVVKNRDLGSSLQQEHDEHEALGVTVGLACDDLSLTLELEGSSLVVHATRITDQVCETVRLALGFGVHQSFVITRSHYVNIDLVAMSQGYVPSYTEAQLDEIEKAVASPT